ncbi:hypothetical protein LV78_002716 [Actinosynnema pretiosum]|nr:hypothetical protein [Actinosynnema pretiosum]
MPTFDLDEESALLLDYGPRLFSVGFDEALRPFVLDEHGKRLKALPKPGAKDDAAKSPAETERLTREGRGTLGHPALPARHAWAGSHLPSTASGRRYPSLPLVTTSSTSVAVPPASRMTIPELPWPATWSSGTIDGHTSEK